MDNAQSIWRGEKILLRAIEPRDWETYFAWNEDDDQARSLDAVPFPQSREVVKRWAEDESLKRPENDAFRFVIETLAGEVIGNLNTYGCDRRVGTFFYGVNVRHEHRRNGYAAEAISLVLRYFFDELRYQKVTVKIFDFNERSVRMHEKLGFQQEGRLRRMGYGEGRFYDLLLFGLTAEEFTARAIYA
jgi:RimJ/RimL family protein N-acetyltransferase